MIPLNKCKSGAAVVGGFGSLLARHMARCGSAGAYCCTLALPSPRLRCRAMRRCCRSSTATRCGIRAALVQPISAADRLLRRVAGGHCVLQQRFRGACCCSDAYTTVPQLQQPWRPALAPAAACKRARRVPAYCLA